MSALNEEDVQRLARLIESLDASAFDYLQLQVGDVKVTIGKGAVPMSASAAAVSTHAVSLSAPTAPMSASAAPMSMPGVPVGGVVAPAVAAPVGAAPPPVTAAPSLVQPTPPGKPATSAAPEGTIEIKSQIMGMYYAQPEPGAPPFVSVGAEIQEDTTVCLIEVMKTFNAMPAGVKGVITEICAENAQLVEYGQVLFRVRPS
jgi:acetyl-CoA carboxylase biotin carboxyl carrier protein